MNWKRATTDEKKIERKEAICQAAFLLFKQNGYDKVSFNNIAAEAGFTKSNMYRYFSSREEIFLNIFSELFERWLDDCCKRLRALEQGAEPSQYADIYVQSLLAHRQFLDLTPILFTSLESNSSYEQLVEFKRLAKGLLFKLAMEIGRIYPEMDMEKAFKLLNLSHAATSSGWAAASDNAALNKLYEQEEFQELKPDFERDLSSAIEIFIRGIQAS